MPIIVSARNARELNREENCGSLEIAIGIKMIESRTFYNNLPRHTEIFVDGGYLALGPAQRNRFLHQRVLTRRGLAVVLDLRRMRLVNIDDGFSSCVIGLYFGDINHGLPPVLDRPVLPWRSVAPELRSPPFCARSLAFPTLGFPEWGCRESSDCAAMCVLLADRFFAAAPPMWSGG